MEEFILLFSPLVATLAIILVILVVVDIIGINSKSRKYRKELTDLYVAGRVRQFATEDNINLDEEYEAFKKWNKKLRMEDKSLDYNIEDEIQERINTKKK